jgi:hypothetical protein
MMNQGRNLEMDLEVNLAKDQEKRVLAESLATGSLE